MESNLGLKPGSLHLQRPRKTYTLTFRNTGRVLERLRQEAQLSPRDRAMRRVS